MHSNSEDPFHASWHASRSGLVSKLIRRLRARQAAPADKHLEEEQLMQLSSLRRHIEVRARHPLPPLPSKPEGHDAGEADDAPLRDR